jgi:hypothetical protein
MCSDWLKFQSSSSLKLMYWLNPNLNCTWMIIGRSFTKLLFFLCQSEIQDGCLCLWTHSVSWMIIEWSLISSPDPKGHVSYCHHWASVRPLTVHILINSSEATGPIWTKLWWNGPWMAPFQNCVRWSRLPAKMATKLKIEKRGYEILIIHCCFSIRVIAWPLFIIVFSSRALPPRVVLLLKIDISRDAITKLNCT